jgi:phenylacetate-CoA oxygenase PaaI subunit
MAGCPESLMLAWADDEYVVGQQLITLTGMYGPDLEEAIAIGSIGQDHLGHALHLYRLVCPDELTVNRLIYERETTAYRSCHLCDIWRPDDWAFIVVRQLLYDLADYERACWAGRFDDPWPGLTGMMARETRLHIEHWSEWCRLLAQDNYGHARLVEAFNITWPLAFDFFVAPEQVPDSWSACQDAWVEVVQAIFGAAGVPIPEGTPTAHIASGRSGRHLPELAHLLSEAHAYHLSRPAWQWE